MIDFLNVTRQKCSDCVSGSKYFLEVTHCCCALLIVDMQWTIQYKNIIMYMP